MICPSWRAVLVYGIDGGFALCGGRGVIRLGPAALSTYLPAIVAQAASLTYEQTPPEPTASARGCEQIELDLCGDSTSTATGGQSASTKPYLSPSPQYPPRRIVPALAVAGMDRPPKCQWWSPRQNMTPL